MSSRVATVIELLSAGRGIEFVRAFEHGAQGTSLARLDGELVVVKAWPTTPERERTLSTGLANARIMAESVPIPPLLERGVIGDSSYLIYACADGEWPPRVDDSLAAQLLEVTDRQRDAATEPNPDWPKVVAGMVFGGDPALDLRPDRLRGHPGGERVLRRAEAAVDACDPGLLRCTDIVHGDFAPENVLVSDGRITAVVDWEQSCTGDIGFDLAGMIYDIELGSKADPQVLAGLYRRIESRMPPDAWRLYTSVYAVRYAGWSIGTEMEAEVLETVDRIAAVVSGAG